MAHNAQLVGLLERLVVTTTGLDSKGQEDNIGKIKDSALRKIRNQSHVRVDQFDIHKRLDGLVEKLAVLNRDDLSEALNDRLNELSKVSSKWTPEILSLFLQLADRPVANSKIEDLAFLNTPEPSTQVTWQEIVEDDPFNETGVWDDIDYGAESDDASVLDATLEPSLFIDETKTFDINEHFAPRVETDVQTSNVEGLERLKQLQFWNFRAWDDSDLSDLPDHLRGLSLVTELQTIREVLFMLHGLPTSLFTFKGTNKSISLNESYRLGHIELDSFHQILQRFAELGSRTNRIRAWTSQTQSVPLNQKFQTAIRKRIGDFDSILVAMESRYVGQKDNVSVSLIDTYHQLVPLSRKLLLLGDLIDQLIEWGSSEDKPPFLCLELLFNATCMEQSIGDDDGFRFFGTLFFECFDTYLEPIRLWMEEGIVDSSNPIFFIRQISDDNPNDLTFNWKDQYEIHKTSSGRLHAPGFLHAVAKKILNTGKSIIFLDRLGIDLQPRDPQESRSLSFESVCVGDSWISLAPFSEMFNVAFDEWIMREHKSVSRVLSHQLYSSCGLWRSIDALERIFCFKNGAVASSFCLPIFNKMDRGKETWNDRFLLTELAHGVFSNIECIDIEKLTIRSLPGAYGDVQSKRRSVKVLSRMVLEYALPWPLLNIIQPSSIWVYQKISTFLLQILRAKLILERLRLLKDLSPEADGDQTENELYYCLRHRLLWFTHTLYSHVTETVLAGAQSDLRERLSKSEDLDDMVESYKKHTSSLEAQCLLAKRLAPIHQAIISLLDLAILFSDAHAAYAGERSFDIANRSFSMYASQLMPNAYRRGKRHRRNENLSSDDEAEESEDEADTSYISFVESPYLQHLKKMRGQFRQLCGFVRTGLQGVSRVAGEPTWDMLAAKLEWGMNPKEDVFGF